MLQRSALDRLTSRALLRRPAASRRERRPDRCPRCHRAALRRQTLPGTRRRFFRHARPTPVGERTIDRFDNVAASTRSTTTQCCPPFSKKPRTAAPRYPVLRRQGKRDSNCCHRETENQSPIGHSLPCAISDNPTNAGTPLLKRRRASARSLPRSTPPATMRSPVTAGTQDLHGGAALQLGLAGGLRDAEDHEFRRPHDGHADLRDHLPDVAHFGRIGLLVALDVERFLAAWRRRAPRSATRSSGRRETLRMILPHSAMSLGSNTTHCVPSSIDFAEEKEKPPDGNVFPFAVAVAADRARSPNGDSSVHVADAVDALRIQQLLLRLADVVAEDRGRRARRRSRELCARRALRRCAHRCRPCVRSAGRRSGPGI